MTNDKGTSSAVRLRRIFRRIARASAASTGLASSALLASQTGACIEADKGDFTGDPYKDSGADVGVSPESPPFDGIIDVNAFQPIRCDAQSMTDLSELATSTNSDYVDIRYQRSNQGGDAAKDPVRIFASGGIVCASASDKGACQGKLDATEPSAGGMLFPSEGPLSAQYVITRTRGDEVTAFRTPSEVAAFVGPIDVPTKAWLRVFMERYRIWCGGEHQVHATQDGFEVIAMGASSCTSTETRFLLRVARDGSVSVLRTEQVKSNGGCPGRRPEGLVPLEPQRGSPLARYFADASYLEAASITAFHRLEEELAIHGAPRSLRRRAARAARDEIRHARMTARMARRFGGAPPKKAVVAAREDRSLEAMAIENTVEGCVRETFAALLATYQADHAHDPSIAAAMRIIAQDETRHAALAWDVAAWLEEKLAPDARARVMQARADAARDMLREAALPVAEELETMAGHPSHDEGARLASELAEALWSR